MITIWQDSPDYGCDDNPSYKWFARLVVDGHIMQQFGPFETKKELMFEPSQPTESVERLARKLCELNEVDPEEQISSIKGDLAWHAHVTDAQSILGVAPNRDD